MMKTIVSIFAIYGAHLSSSQAPWDPPSMQGPPVGAVQPMQPPAQPIQPMQPPAQPQGQGVGAPPLAAPGAGGPPATIPGAAPGAAPGTGGAWIPPAIPSLTSPAAQQSMQCNKLNTDPTGCAGRITSITNAARNFNMECNNLGSCAAATLEFKFENSWVERVERVAFSEMYAGYGATVIMDSTASARNQYLDKFECKAYGACEGTTVELFGGSGLNDVDCAYPSYCQGCTISVCEWVINPMNGLKSKLCGTPKPCFGY